MKKCRVCHTPSPLLHNFDFIKLYCCPNCTLVFSGKNHHRLRTSDWGQESAEFDNYYSKQFALKDQTSYNLLKSQKLHRPGRVLDIGCASGSFLNFMKQKGWQVAGVEPSKSLCQIAKKTYGLKLHNQEFDPQIFKFKFDLVTFFDVIEHIPDPKQFLELVTQVVKPGGHILIKVPNWQSLTVQLCIASYYLSGKQILEPVRMVTQAEYNYHHTSYFTKDSLSFLAHSVGLKLKHATTETTILAPHFFSRFEFNSLPALAKTLGRLSLESLQQLEQLTNKRDTLTIILKKPNKTKPRKV